MSDLRTDGIQNRNNEEYFDELVQNQMKNLGDNPTIIDAVSVILKQSAKAEYEA